MFVALLTFLIAFAAAHSFFSAAIIYHLWRYTLPDWSAPKVVIPAYLALSLLFFGLAVLSLFRV